VDVKVIINHAPQVTSMESSNGRAEAGIPIDLGTIATDPDGDSLTYAWTSTCPGSFDRTDLEQVRLTPSVIAGLTACSIEVDVSDGHGGVGRGVLVLTTVQPRINVAPKMDVVHQSTDIVGGGDVVVLHATASDPDGQALTWNWTAEDGTFLNQVDDAQSSDVHWIAPAATPGTTFKVVVTASDPDGGSATFAFDVSVHN
jgi:hypothetical protein